MRKENEDENKPGRKEEDDELRCKENENGGAEETPEKCTEKIGEEEQRRSGARRRDDENSEKWKGNRINEEKGREQINNAFTEPERKSRRNGKMQ